MSSRVSALQSLTQHDRMNVIAMEDFCQLMESPMFVQPTQRHHHLQPHLSVNDSFGRAHARPEAQHHPYHHHQTQPQLLFIPEPQQQHHHHHQAKPQPQLSFSDSFGRRPEPQHHHHHHQQPQFSHSGSFGRGQHVPEAHYSRAQATEYDLVTEPVKRAETQHTLRESVKLGEAKYSIREPAKRPEPQYNIREESIDKEAGEFIKLRHKKFQLSK